MLRKLLSIAIVLCFAWPQFATAQDIGSVRISTVYANPFGSGSTACTGNPQIASVPNNGQTGHYIAYTTSGSPSFVTVQMSGQYSTTGTVFTLSDAATNPSGGELQANGNYPIMSVSVTCASGASFTLSYSGQGVPTGPAAGANLQSQILKRLLTGVSINSGGEAGVTTPFGSASGSILLDAPTATIPAGTTVTITCSDVSPPNDRYALFNYPVPTTGGEYSFPVPPVPCGQLQVALVSLGGGSGTFNLSYDFFPPGFSAPAFRYAHFTGTTATAVTNQSSLIHTVSINTGGAGTISIFDLASGLCTGTPSTNPVAVITATATTLQSFIYDVNVVQGICVKASVAMDFTLSYQ